MNSCALLVGELRPCKSNYQVQTVETYCELDHSGYILGANIYSDMDTTQNARESGAAFCVHWSTSGAQPDSAMHSHRTVCTGPTHILAQCVPCKAPPAGAC